MTLTIIVEDGTSVANANAYESTADTATRLDDLGLTLFGTLLAANQAAALFRGTADIEQRVFPHLTGRRSVSTQGLGYPRTMGYHGSIVLTSTAIPGDLILACAYSTAAEAQRISDGDAARVDPGVKRARSTLGAETEYFGSASARAGLSLVDDRAASYVRALISRRRAA